MINAKKFLQQKWWKFHEMTAAWIIFCGWSGFCHCVWCVVCGVVLSLCVVCGVKTEMRDKEERWGLTMISSTLASFLLARSGVDTDWTLVGTQSVIRPPWGDQHNTTIRTYIGQYEILPALESHLTCYIQTPLLLSVKPLNSFSKGSQNLNFFIFQFAKWTFISISLIL